MYQVLQQPVVPTSMLFSLTLLNSVFFLFLYIQHAKHECSPFNEKRLSWVLTFTSSLICTLVSIPFVIRFIYSGMDMALLSKDSAFHTGFICFFISYLVLDLVLGSIYYRQRITLVTGWIHHMFYIVALFWLLRLKIASLFTVASILELPTLILAAGSMKHEWRSDYLFGSTFFALRLVAHAWMMVALKRYHRIGYIWILALIIYPLHMYWFYGKQFMLLTLSN